MCSIRTARSACAPRARPSAAAIPPTPVVALATAHPAKFPDAVERATGAAPALPPHLADLMERDGARSRCCPTIRRRSRRFIRDRARAAAGRCRMNQHFVREPSDRHHAARQRPHGRHRAHARDRHRDARRLGRRRLAPRARRTSMGCRISSSTWRSRARAAARARQIAEDIENVGGDINAATERRVDELHRARARRERRTRARRASATS